MIFDCCLRVVCEVFSCFLFICWIADRSFFSWAYFFSWLWIYRRRGERAPELGLLRTGLLRWSLCLKLYICRCHTIIIIGYGIAGTILYTINFASIGRGWDRIHLCWIGFYRWVGIGRSDVLLCSIGSPVDLDYCCCLFVPFWVFFVRLIIVYLFFIYIILFNIWWLFFF